MEAVQTNGLGSSLWAWALLWNLGLEYQHWRHTTLPGAL